MFSTTSRNEQGPGASRQRRAFPVLLVFAAALLLTGCLSMDTPDGFLKTAESGDQIKAVSSDSALLWVRTFRDPYDGDLAFWSDALYNDLVENRGYTLKEKKAIQCGEDGLDGEELLFETAAAGSTQRYLVSLFVRGGIFSRKICVVEFVGSGDAFDEHVDAVRDAVQTLSF